MLESASTASVGGADGAAALHMHEAGGEGAGGRVKSFLVSFKFERRRRMKIYRPLASADRCLRALQEAWLN